MAIDIRKEGPWELPEGWVWARLGDLVDLRKEKTYPDPQSELPFVGMDDVPSDSLLIETIGKFASMRSAGNKFYAGDVLYGRLRPYLNKVVVPDFKGVASGEFIVMQAKDGIEPRFLQLAMHSRRFVNDATRDTSGDRPRVSFETLAEIDIAIAPSSEQRRIVARIDEFLTEIADGEGALTRARTDLDTWRRALLKAAVTGELTREWREANRSNETGSDLFDRINKAVAAAKTGATGRAKARSTDTDVDLADLPEIPSQWRWARVGEIGIVSGGITQNANRMALPRRLPFLRVANVQYGKLDLSETRQIGVTDEELYRVLLNPNDLLVVEGNGSVDQIGRCAIWNGEIEPCIHQNHIIKVRFALKELSAWAFHWLMSPHGRQLVTRVASSTSGLHTLSLSKIEAVPIPIPPSGELAKILATIEAEGETETSLEHDFAESGSTVVPLRQSILKAAFEGQLVGQDAADEPADRLLARLSAFPMVAAPTTRRRAVRTRRAAQ